MKIDKSKLKLGIWYEDEEGNRIQRDDYCLVPNAYCHVIFPLEIQEKIYKTDTEGHYGGKDLVCTFSTHLSDYSGKLAVAMANSGDYILSEALAVLANCCERCHNVLINKYLPEDGEGYAEYSSEWQKCGTFCDFCKDEGTNMGSRQKHAT